MKKIIQKEVTFCDFCGKEDYVNACLRCSKEACWRCRDKEGVVYTVGVNTGGTGDGFYCRECDIDLFEGEGDELHQAYLAVRRLRLEQEGYHKDFRARQDAAEKHLRRLVEKAGVL